MALIKTIIEPFMIKGLFENTEYSNILIPFLDKKHVVEQEHQIIFEKYKDYVLEYKKHPSYNEVLYNITKDSFIDETTKSNTLAKLETISKQELNYKSTEWLVQESEKHIQEKLFQDAVLLSAKTFQDENESKLRPKLPELMKDALAFTFNTTIGREYGTDSTIKSQHEYYNMPENRLPFAEWDYFNRVVTRGGTSKKKIHFAIAGSGVGKTLFLTNLADQYVKSGYKVLYLTGEDGEERINERVDGNIFDTATSDLKHIDENNYKSKIKWYMNSNKGGRLIIKQFAPKKMSAKKIEFLLDELKTKENFQCDVLIVDYLTLLASDMYSSIKDTNSYYTSVTEELRALSIEQDMVVWSALQFNRTGMKNSDPEMTDVADSIGIIFTSDLGIAILEPSELKSENKYLFKQLKSRYTPIQDTTEKFIMSVDKEKQKITELVKPQADLNENNKSKSKEEETIDTVVHNIEDNTSQFLIEESEKIEWNN